MATTTTTEAPVAGTDIEAAKDVTNALEAGSLTNLKTAWDGAKKDFDEASAVVLTASHARAVAAVWLSRVAYRTATHASVATSRYPYNITGAAKALGMPVGTLRPYALAGAALHKADRAGLLSSPAEEDVALVEKSFDDTSRADQKAKRLKEKERKEALEAKSRELEALKKAGADKAPATGQAPAKAPEGPQAPATDAKAPEAPAKAPEAGPSLTEDVLATAKTLVRQIKALRTSKEWSPVAKDVVAILTEAFPVLKG